MEAKIRRWLQTAAIILSSVVAQALASEIGWIATAVWDNAALVMCMLLFGMKYAAVTAVAVPWAAAVMGFMEPVLTYVMIISNVICVLLWRLFQNRKLWAWVLASCTRALLLWAMTQLVIATWLEPHLSKYNAIHYNIVKEAVETFGLLRQLPTAILGGALAIVLVKTQKKYEDMREERR